MLSLIRDTRESVGMKLCDRCGLPIHGKLIVVVMDQDADFVCESCWYGFVDYLSQVDPQAANETDSEE